MVAKSFRLAGLSTVYHNKTTRSIFERLEGNRSEIIGEAIVKFATKKGFNPSKFSVDYVSEDRLEVIKSFEKKQKRVDYTYLYAFEFLKYNMPLVNKSVIIREAISNFLG
jgi:hypothetical protein